MIADWYVAATFSLAETSNFIASPESVSRRLSISTSQAKEALSRLERLGCLERNQRGRLVSSGKKYAAPRSAGNYFHKHHMENLELALTALDEYQKEKSSFSGIVMAVDPTKIPEAIQRIEAFRRDLCRFLEGGKRKQVFRMNIQLFPLSDKSDSK